ncbi:dTDP-4-dehydrorhamnose 3,5-epimerase [Streptomyces sp. NPDC020742]|uniref:dTDP-4-dehydrorhamnose 3,5-epimerase family protein n=1 Tax=unclassified Streptomyces TaxID=2593676 RepID=UPI003403CABA
MGIVITRSMQVRPLRIPDVLLVTSTPFADDRGQFFETYREDALSEAVGRPVRIVQTNVSVSHRGVLRGIHGTAVPPGQAKLVSCLRGTILDFAVDLRVGSPTFGSYEMTVLDAGSGAAVYLGEGMGHAFYAVEDDTCVQYQCTAGYVPQDVVTVDVFDPEIGLPLQLPRPPIMSPGDADAPSLRELLDAGRLPPYEACPGQAG